MWARTACTSSGVMSVTPWCEAAWTATWEKMPSSSGALKCALQPGTTSPQEKVFMAGPFSGVGRAGLPGGPDSGGEVLDAQQAEDGAGRVGAEDRLEAVGRGPGEGAHQRLGDVGRGVRGSWAGGGGRGRGGGGGGGGGGPRGRGGGTGGGAPAPRRGRPRAPGA